MKYIFSDFIIEKLEKDRFYPGVFIKLIKPKNWVEKNLADYELYSIILDKKIKNLTDKEIKQSAKIFYRSRFLKRIINKIGKFVFKLFRLRWIAG